MQISSEKTKSIKHNYLMNMLLTISTILFPLISFPYVSRILKPEGIGRVAFASSLISYFSMFAQLGISTYGIRETARIRDNKSELSKFVKEIMSINIITCLISYTFFFLSLVFVPRLQNDKALYLCMSSSILFTACGLEWMYQGLEKYDYITKRSILFKLIAFLGMFLIIRTKNDVLQYGILTVVASVGSNVCNLINARKYISIKNVKIEAAETIRHLKPIFTFFSMSVATTIYTNLDNIMIGFMSTNNQVGYYNAATKVKAALVSVVASLGTVILPRASYYIKNGYNEEFHKLSYKALNFTMIVSIPLTLYFFAFAKHCILVLSGSEYLPAIESLQILLPTVIFIGLTNVIGMQVLVPLGKEKIVLFSVIVGALIDFIINFILIGQFGAAGAAVGTLVAEGVVLIVQFQSYKSDLLASFRKIKLMKILCASLLSFALSYYIAQFIGDDLLNLICTFIVFSFVYCLSLFIMKEPLVYSYSISYINKMRVNK